LFVLIREQDRVGGLTRQLQQTGEAMTRLQREKQGKNKTVVLLGVVLLLICLLFAESVRQRDLLAAELRTKEQESEALMSEMGSIVNGIEGAQYCEMIGVDELIGVL
jgi:hypothetical protein